MSARRVVRFADDREDRTLSCFASVAATIRLHVYPSIARQTEKSNNSRPAVSSYYLRSLALDIALDLASSARS